MKKNNIAIIVGVVVVAIIIFLLILFGSKKEVTFDTQGGSIVPTQEVGYMKKAKRPANPTREGYTFDNWYYDEIVFDFDTKVTKDMTLIAGWIKDNAETPDKEEGYTVKFDTDGGSSIASITVEKEGKISAPEEPTREGYKFLGWQLDGKDYNFSSKITKNMTLKAKWEKVDSEPVGGEKAPSLSTKNFSLKVGQSKKISVYNAKGKATWKSSNTKVATVDANGSVKAIKEGTATITATVDGKTLTVKVTVTKEAETKPTDPVTPTDPVKPTDPTEPTKPVEPEETYSVVCTPIGGVLDQCRIDIISSKGGTVKGKVHLYEKFGDYEVNSGFTLPKSDFIRGTVVSTN